MNRRALGLAVALSCAAWPCRSALAQSNYRLAPVGGRTTLVGGTGLAFGRDSASAFLNPATVVRVDSGRLSFSVNAYELSASTAPRWYRPGTVDAARFGDVPANGASVTNYGFDSLPGSLCIFLRVADVPFLAGNASKELREARARLGICLATVQESDYGFNGEDYAKSTPTGGTRQAQSVRQTFRRIAVGPTYSMYTSNSLAIGASLHLSRASFRSLFESQANTSGGNAGPISSIFFNSARGDSYDISATLGATYRIGRFQTVAAALELPSLHAFGPGGLNRYVHVDGGDTSGAESRTSSVTANGDFAAYTPLRIALGTGIERPWGSVEVNVSAHIPLGPAYRADFSGRSLEINRGVSAENAVNIAPAPRARGAVNIGVGGERFLNPSLSLLGGVSTDISTVPQGALLADPLTYFQARTHMVATSFGVGSHGEGGDLLFGGSFGYTWGERFVVDSYKTTPTFETTPQHAFSLLIVIAGTTSFKAIRRAVDDLTQAVDPTVKPNQKANEKSETKEDPKKSSSPIP